MPKCHVHLVLLYVLRRLTTLVWKYSLHYINTSSKQWCYSVILETTPYQKKNQKKNCTDFNSINFSKSWKGMKPAWVQISAPSNRVHLEKLIVVQLVNKFAAIYETRCTLPCSQESATALILSEMHAAQIFIRISYYLF